MRHFDLSPLYRSTVGFDRLFDMLDSSGVETNGPTYPPYNIERTGEDAYRVTMAVAGFGKDDIDIVAKENVLTVKAESRKKRPTRPVKCSIRALPRVPLSAVSSSPTTFR